MLAHLHFWIVLKRWGGRAEKFSMENGVDIGDLSWQDQLFRK
jgi:hypothetical protein